MERINKNILVAGIAMEDIEIGELVVFVQNPDGSTGFCRRAVIEDFEQKEDNNG